MEWANRILATGGALKSRKSGILAFEHHIWLHRSPRKLFCVHSIELLILHFHLPGFVKIWHTACSTASETSIFLQTHKWNFSIKNQQFRTFGKKFEISTFPELYRASYNIFRQTLVGGSVKWVLLWNPHKIFFLATGGARSGAERLKSHFFFIWVLHRSPIFDMSPDSGRRHQNWLPTTRVCHLDLRKKKPRHILIQTSPRIREMTDLNENLQGESCKSKLQNVTPTAVFTGSA